MRPVSLADACFYRALTPRWAHDPVSGEGAAITGGRFNPVGYAALYLSNDVETAIREAQQSLLIMPPKTICSYQVTIANVIDFSEGYTGQPQPIEWSMWDCNWRKIWNMEEQRPPSWELADDLISSGVGGLLFPSLRNKGGSNLVAFLGNFDDGDVINCNDPNADLPLDQSSWQKP